MDGHTRFKGRRAQEQKKMMPNSPACPQAKRPTPNGSGHAISVKMTALVTVRLWKNRVVEMRGSTERETKQGSKCGSEEEV